MLGGMLAESNGRFCRAFLADVKVVTLKALETKSSEVRRLAHVARDADVAYCHVNRRRHVPSSALKYPTTMSYKEIFSVMNNVQKIGITVLRLAQ